MAWGSTHQVLQIVARHISSSPEPPSRHGMYSMPHALEAIVLDCLKKKPSDRPATARELGDVLGYCVEEPWTREDARRWWETRLEPEALVSLVD